MRETHGKYAKPSVLAPEVSDVVWYESAYGGRANKRSFDSLWGDCAGPESVIIIPDFQNDAFLGWELIQGKRFEHRRVWNTDSVPFLMTDNLHAYVYYPYDPEPLRRALHGTTSSRRWDRFI
jgi:hypothetical protein